MATQAPEHKDNKPLKGGVFIVLDLEMADWLVTQMSDVQELYAQALDETPLGPEGEEPTSPKPSLLLERLEKLGWIRVDDKFGKKAYVTTPHPEGMGHHGELRFGVVAKADGLHLDIRLWGQY